MVIKHAKTGVSRFIQTAFVASASVGATVGLFILLPIINAIAEGARADTLVMPIETAEIPPPPDVVEEEEPEPEEPEPEEEPPELEEDPQQDLSLEAMEAILAEGFGEGIGPAQGFDLDLTNVAGGRSLDELFSTADLDSKPTPIHQPPPSLTAKEKAATPGRVVLIFIIDSKGRVKQPKVTSSSNPALEAVALRTVKKWRYQPPSRDGKPVRTRSRQQIDFPKQK